ncbi:hypothetical protein WR25_11592 [Diploscapter pachys]|uniref:Uncharacterized protein n=1 Tax=Diploscapter pachys TaxID=2018661 RepID=A0A2A2KR99_9BILA|nr:hypothetical protein WR25_11592 [Diploscapter pachys]
MGEDDTVSNEFLPKKYKNEYMKGKRLDEDDQKDDRNQLYWQKSSNVHLKQRDGYSDILPSSRNNPFVFAPPVSQSTPKTAHQTLVRPPMQKEQKLTWGRLPSLSRPASAMPAIAYNNPYHPNMHGVQIHDRYPSYTTLPRPDELSIKQLEATLAARRMSNTPSYASGMPIPLNSHLPVPCFEPIPPVPILAVQQPPKPLVDWTAVSTRCSMAVLSSLTIFALGAARMWQGAKWAIGIELVYAVMCLLAAFSGLFAAKTANFTGLFPTIPMSFPELNPSVFISRSEPLLLDLALSVACLVQIFVSISISYSGCRCLASLCSAVEELRLSSEIQSVFYENKQPVYSKNP